MGVTKKLTFQLGLDFFGLTSETAPIYRINLFTQIHDIVFHGKGGYDWETIYNMPRWLRQFTFSKINDFYTQEAEAIEASQSKGKSRSTLIDPSGNINKEGWKDVQPNKAPKSSKVKYG